MLKHTTYALAERMEVLRQITMCQKVYKDNQIALIIRVMWLESISLKV